MNKLKISLLKGTLQDEYQLVDISIKNEANSISIFCGNINLSKFLEWLFHNESEIKTSELPINTRDSGSLAYQIWHFYESEEIENDIIVDAMFDYRASHCLRFGVRGTDFPEIYIGKLGCKHEISMFTSNDSWRYFIDIYYFYKNLTILTYNK
ncbi:TPA: hypothetical protein ACG3ZG_003843 [Yersinia enterocolitica]|nr:hypothetical protein [Yersinia enterocolitica]HDL8439157.1 hypothetical protein [Yersinia enterocolitica]HEF9707506.1 hypothetical protein [Yersinia enterocolitica]